MVYDGPKIAQETLKSGGQDYLTGHLLVAMPTIGDNFEKSVVYICAHSDDGAMGLVINKPVDHITFPELLDQLGIADDAPSNEIRVHYGGPVDPSRGFVLHSGDYFIENSTLQVSDQIGLTATVDVLRAIAEGSGPSSSILALGYAGWSAGQLENEIKANGWLSCPARMDLIFNSALDDKWDMALATLGADPARLSMLSGNA